MSSQPILYLGLTAKVIPDGTVDLNTANIINATSITASSITGALTGTATNTSGINTISDNSNTSCYIPFTKSTAGTSRPLYVDDTSGPLVYNPSTSTLSATNFSGLLDTGGLVYLQTASATITGSASSVTFNLANLFNSTYKNYRIVLSPSTQLSFTAYPAYSLYAFLGTSVPTGAILSGSEVISNAPSTVTALYTNASTLTTTPLVVAVSQSVNHQNVLEVENVGFACTALQQTAIKCKSFYGNPGVSGSSDRCIQCSPLSGCTITGLTLQQSSIGSGNNMVLNATVYGYK